MSFENLLIDQKGLIQYITINRESKLNALNNATLGELSLAIHNAFENTEVGGVIVTGAGTKAFVAGADIAELATLDATGGRTLARENQANVFDLIANGSKPFIAAINGFALGGGLELAMACHIRIASVNAKMGLPEVSLGLIPGYGGTQRLTQLVGKGKAMEMILTGEMISAEQAYKYGLINYVIEEDGLLPKAEELLNKILSRSPLAVAAAIKAVNAAMPDTGFTTEIDAFGACFGTDDFKEGTTAFLNKRSPEFRSTKS
jgi:enoyl-CoA hydratase